MVAMLLPFEVHNGARSFYMSQTLSSFGSVTRSPAGIFLSLLSSKIWRQSVTGNIYTCLISATDMSFIPFNNKMQNDNNLESSAQYNWFPFPTLVGSLKI
jgi:hypothetical protein